MSSAVKYDMRPPCPQHGIHRSECRVVVLYFVVTLTVAARVVTGLDSIEFQKTCKCRYMCDLLSAFAVSKLTAEI